MKTISVLFQLVLWAVASLGFSPVLAHGRRLDLSEGRGDSLEVLLVVAHLAHGQAVHLV